MNGDVAVVKRTECGLCRRDVEANDMCGRLWLDGDCAAHHKCMQYSSQLAQSYEEKTFGGFDPDEVRDEISRGKHLKCVVCKKAGDTTKRKLRGATCGCCVARCHATFHYPCAKESAITARLINNQTRLVQYVVFCTEKHKNQFYEENPKKYKYTDEMSDEETEQSSSGAPVRCTVFGIPAVFGTVETLSKPDLMCESTKRNPTESSSQDHDFVLCFVECNGTVLTTQHENEVKAFAEQIYKVGQKHVIIWVPNDSALTSEHMIYLMQELTHAFRERNYEDLERLLVGLSEGDVNKYESFDQLHKNFGEEKRKLIHTMIHDAIKRDLSEAETTAGTGKLCKVRKTPVFILYLRVCDVTDPLYRIRSRLSRK